MAAATAKLAITAAKGSQRKVAVNILAAAKKS